MILNDLFKLIIVLLIFGLFFVQKVGEDHKRLDSPYDQIYNVFANIFNPISEILKSIKPIPIGRNLSLDVVPFVILAILAILLSRI